MPSIVSIRGNDIERATAVENGVELGVVTQKGHVAQAQFALDSSRAVLKEFGTELPDSVTLRVHDSNADMRYLVVPMRPAGTEGWSEEKLAGIITRDSLVGVTVPKAG